ncbi:MAG TPA: LysM domain-containing protein [Candidatus Limnocylindrales bacterium]|nr:LysM domain-containing protein [Candidatus Limnocylindrales bacterium]
MEQDGRSSTFGEATEPSTDPVAWDQLVEPVPPIAGESLAATIAALADPATRSPKPDTCPFLRTIDGAGSATPPVEWSDPANRCVAVGEPTPQSSRQQELVCLTSGHNNCPRYLRGALVAADALAPVAIRRGPSVPVVASALLLVAAASMSVGFLLVRGGFDLPVAPTASQVAIAPSALPPVASSEPTQTVPAPPTASPPPASPASTEPAPTEPPPSPSPAPPKATPASTSDRYLLLVPCPGTADCWIYTVRSGDNLVSIANYFGVDYDTVLDMNPDIGEPTTIRAGDDIRMPPPTR